MGQEERIAKEGREVVGDDFFKGELIKRNRMCGWIKPHGIGKMPAEVKTKLKQMTKTMKQKAKEKGTQDNFSENAIYVRMTDVVEGVKLESGMKLKFKLYTDSEGVGACEVQED